MAAKLIAAILTFVASTASGIFLFFMLLLALNGFNEADGIYGIVVYVFVTLCAIIVTTTGSWFATSRLLKRSLNSIIAVTVPAVGFVIVAILMQFLSMFIGVLIASFVQKNL